MTAHEENQFLESGINALQLSLQCKRALHANQIKSMKQLIKHPTYEVERWPGFNIQLVHEYISLLESKGLGQLIDRY